MHADLFVSKLKVWLAIEAAGGEVAESKAKGEIALAVEGKAQIYAHRFCEPEV